MQQLELPFPEQHKTLELNMEQIKTMISKMSLTELCIIYYAVWSEMADREAPK